MTLEYELRQCIEFYESELSEELLEEARRKSILSFTVEEANKDGKSYVEYLVETYREKLKDEYYRNVKRSGK